MNGEALPIKLVNPTEIINTYGDSMYSRTSDYKIRMSDMVNENVTDYASKFKDKMSGIEVSTQEIESFLHSAMEEVESKACENLERIKMSISSSLDQIKIEMSEMNKIKLSPEEVKSRMSKINQIFQGALEFPNNSFISGQIEGLEEEMFKKFNIEDSNMRRNIRDIHYEMIDSLMKGYNEEHKKMTEEFEMEFKRSAEQLEIGLNQEQKVTEALDHPEQLEPEEIIVYAEGKTSEELQESYDAARTRIQNDTTLSVNKMNEQLAALDSIYSRVNQNGITQNAKVEQTPELVTLPPEYEAEKQRILNDPTLSEEDKKLQIDNLMLSYNEGRALEGPSMNNGSGPRLA